MAMDIVSTTISLIELCATIAENIKFVGQKTHELATLDGITTQCKHTLGEIKLSLEAKEGSQFKDEESLQSSLTQLDAALKEASEYMTKLRDKRSVYWFVKAAKVKGRLEEHSNCLRRTRLDAHITLQTIRSRPKAPMEELLQAKAAVYTREKTLAAADLEKHVQARSRESTSQAAPEKKLDMDAATQASLEQASELLQLIDQAIELNGRMDIWSSLAITLLEHAEKAKLAMDEYKRQANLLGAKDDILRDINDMLSDIERQLKDASLRPKKRETLEGQKAKWEKEKVDREGKVDHKELDRFKDEVNLCLKGLHQTFQAFTSKTSMEMLNRANLKEEDLDFQLLPADLPKLILIFRSWKDQTAKAFQNVIPLAQARISKVNFKSPPPNELEEMKKMLENMRTQIEDLLDKEDATNGQQIVIQLMTFMTSHILPKV